MNKIVSNTLLKLIAGISGTTNDVLVDFYNSSMTEMLAEILELDDFARHTVTRERTKVYDEFLRLEQFPVVASSITIENDIFQVVTGYTFNTEDYKMLTLGSNGLPTVLPYEEVLASYTAGYIVQDTITPLVFGDLVGKTLSIINRITGVSTTYTFVSGTPSTNQIQAVTSNAITAGNISTAVGGSLISSTVTFPLDTNITSTTIVSANATVQTNDMPLNMKTAVALMVSGAMLEKQNIGSVSSFSIGSKTVNFRNKTDMRTFNDIVNQYAGFYKTPTVLTA